MNIIWGQGWQYLLDGVTVGGIYALVAVGFVLIYNVTGIINFAQGEFAMLGAMAMVAFRAGGWPFLPAFAAAVLVSCAVGGGVERVAIRPARDASPITLIFITLGLDIAIRGAGLLVWGTNPRPLAPFTAGPAVRLLGGVVPRQGLWVLGSTVVIALVLYLFFERTRSGSAVKAAMYNRGAARLYGMNPGRYSFWSFVAAAAIGAVAGIVVAPMTTATYDMGLNLGLNGFVAAILGGLTSLPGAVVGGIFLGILENLAGGFLSTGWEQGVAFILLVLVLLVRPQGLLGSSEDKRV